MSTLYTMVAPCFFGTESTLNFEVKRLGAQNIQVTDGRVAFQGGADVIAAANLNLRTAERVLLLLATYKATTFDELFDGCYNIAWEDLLPANAAFPVKGSSLSSQLSSVPACQSIVKKAIVKRLMHGHKVGTLPEDGALYKVRFALRKDTVEIYLDTSGDGLHKRGYRKNATLAPIKETLAAAIADLGRVRPTASAWATHPRPPALPERWARSGRRTPRRGSTPSPRTPSLSSTLAKRPRAAAKFTTA